MLIYDVTKFLFDLSYFLIKLYFVCVGRLDGLVWVFLSFIILFY